MIISYKLIRRILFKTIILLLVLISGLIAPILLLFPLGPIYLFRFVLSQFIVPKWFPQLGKILTTRSTIYASDGIFTRPNNTLLVTATLDGGGDLDIDTLRREALDKVISRRLRDDLEWPEMQQSLCTFCGFYFWKKSPFDIRNHIKEFTGKNVNLGEIQRDLLRKPFKMGQPLWEVLLLKDPPGVNNNNGSAILFLRLHHCLVDGIGITQILLKVLGKSSDNLAKPVILNSNKGPQWLEGLIFSLKAPFEFFQQILSAFDWNFWHFGGKRGASKEISLCSEHPPLSLDLLRRIKKLHEVYVSSVLMAAVGGAIRKSMVKSGGSLPRNIHCISPLRVLDHPEKLRNCFSGCFVRLPILEPDPLERLQLIHKHLEKIKRSTVPDFIYSLMPLAGALFPFMIKIGFRNFLTTALLTSLPGPPEDIQICGFKCTDLTLGSGLLPGNTAILLTALSYNGTLRISGFGDKSFFPGDTNVQEFIKFMREELDLLQSQFPSHKV